MGALHYLKDIKIIAQNESKQYTTLTDRDGLYRFNGLLARKYQVYPNPPAEYKYKVSWDNVSEITIQSPSDPSQYYYELEESNVYSNIRLE